LFIQKLFPIKTYEFFVDEALIFNEMGFAGELNGSFDGKGEGWACQR
jgi:hypothetical protein